MSHEFVGAFWSVAFWAAGVMFTAAALLSVYRIIRGPSILDRMIASDVLLTTLILVIGAEMVYNGHTRSVPMMLVLAATAVFATIAVARYVSKQDLSIRRDAEEIDLPTADQLGSPDQSGPSDQSDASYESGSSDELGSSEKPSADEPSADENAGTAR